MCPISGAVSHSTTAVTGNYTGVFSFLFLGGSASRMCPISEAVLRSTAAVTGYYTGVFSFLFLGGSATTVVECVQFQRR